MIKSMTGYGRAQRSLGGKDITVEIRAVNHRYFEYSSRLPRAYGYLDDKLKKLVQSGASRGKVDVGLVIISSEGAGAHVEINHELANGYLDALRALGRELAIEDDISLSAISRFSDIFVVQRPVEDEDAIWAEVSAVATEALNNFVAMRGVEGDKLRGDILERLLLIEDAVTVIEQRSPQTVADYRARLTAKLHEILGNNTLDEGRLLTEVAIMGEKLAVDEETVRLRSHLAQLRAILGEPDAVGRKLDFLVQELNREINTIGSKSQDVSLARVVVEVKSEIEKIREQIQNIE